MRQSGYLAKQKKAVGIFRQAEKDTYIQFMTDTLMLTLNDPKIMGKDVFGKKRIEKVVYAWGKMYDQFHGALEKGVEAEYFQEKLDQALIRILGEDGFNPFPERYYWIGEAK